MAGSGNSRLLRWLVALIRASVVVTRCHDFHSSTASLTNTPWNARPRIVQISSVMDCRLVNSFRLLHSPNMLVNGIKVRAEMRSDEEAQ